MSQVVWPGQMHCGLAQRETGLGDPPGKMSGVFFNQVSTAPHIVVYGCMSPACGDVKGLHGTRSTGGFFMLLLYVHVNVYSYMYV